MFSFSPKWLWAQSLVIAAGMYLLGVMTIPGDSSLHTISGRVKTVQMSHRKSIGGVFEVALVSQSGEWSNVLIPMEAASEVAVRRLVGQKMTTKVNWSSVAVEVDAGSPALAEGVHRTMKAKKRFFDVIAFVAVIAALSFGVATFGYGFGRDMA